MAAVTSFCSTHLTPNEVKKKNSLAKFSCHEIIDGRKNFKFSVIALSQMN